MDTFPEELLERIINLACTDYDGSRARALSQVSHSFRRIVLPRPYEIISVTIAGPHAVPSGLIDTLQLRDNYKQVKMLVLRCTSANDRPINSPTLKSLAELVSSHVTHIILWNTAPIELSFFLRLSYQWRHLEELTLIERHNDHGAHKEYGESPPARFPSLRRVTLVGTPLWLTHLHRSAAPSLDSVRISELRPHWFTKFTSDSSHNLRWNPSRDIISKIREWEISFRIEEHERIPNPSWVTDDLQAMRQKGGSNVMIVASQLKPFPMSREEENEMSVNDLDEYVGGMFRGEKFLVLEPDSYESAH